MRTKREPSRTKPSVSMGLFYTTGIIFSYFAPNRRRKKGNQSSSKTTSFQPASTDTTRGRSAILQDRFWLFFRTSHDARALPVSSFFTYDAHRLPSPLMMELRRHQAKRVILFSYGEKKHDIPHLLSGSVSFWLGFVVLSTILMSILATFVCAAMMIV